jgi:acetate---CoA ligase (ADP-forming)
MREIFYPSSVAVIGVSPKPDNLGRNIVANLVELWLRWHRLCRRSKRRDDRDPADLPGGRRYPRPHRPGGDPDPRYNRPGRAGRVRSKGHPLGDHRDGRLPRVWRGGKKLEDEIVQVASKYGIRFVGPNCIGAINMENGFCVPFPRLTKFVKRGEVSMISQSGGVGMSVLNLMANEGLGLNKFVSVG